MKTVVLDTSNTYVVVALYENDKCLASIQEQGNQRQSEYTILYLQQLIEQQNWKLTDVDEMVITIGPGSYTGVRVALTIAKTLATVTPIKVKTVSSLQAYVGMGSAISILDARSKKMYVGVYEMGKAIIEEQLVTKEEFNDFRKRYSEYPIVGQTSLIDGEEIAVNLYQNIYEIAKELSYVENVDALVPHYIKEVEAKKLCQSKK